jgi:hypothetical protein
MPIGELVTFMWIQIVECGVTKCLLLPMWSACHFCCFCWCCALSELSGPLCSQHPDLIDEAHLGSLVGFAASKPLHLQGVGVAVECAATAAATAGFLLPRTGLN